MIGKLGFQKAAQTLGLSKKPNPTAASKGSETPKSGSPATDEVTISGGTNEVDQPLDARKLGIGAAIAATVGVGLTVAAAAVTSPLVIPALMLTMVSSTVSYASLKTLGDAPPEAKQGVADVAQAQNTAVQAMNGDTQKPLLMLEGPKTDAG